MDGLGSQRVEQSIKDLCMDCMWGTIKWALLKNSHIKSIIYTMTFYKLNKERHVMKTQT